MVTQQKFHNVNKSFIFSFTSSDELGKIVEGAMSSNQLRQTLIHVTQKTAQGTFNISKAL